MDKQKIKARQKEILGYLEVFCKEKLNEEYFLISKKLLEKLGRKRSVPFVSGQTQIWAAAIIHALGTINFLFDKAEEPYVSIDELNDFFGTKKTTTGGKSKQIRDLLKLRHWDHEFSVQSMKENNPYTDNVMVDGLIVPVESIPEEYQQMLREARSKGKDISFKTK